MNNIYWAPVAPQSFSEIMYHRPEKLLADLNTPLFKESGILNCPSFTGHLKDTYIIRSPVDIEIGYDHNLQTWRCTWLDDRSEIFSVRNAQHQLFSIFINYTLIADDRDTSMHIQPAYYHNTEFNNRTTVISGEVDIGQYIRGTDCAFVLKPEFDTVKIKNGDPLFYLTIKSKNRYKMRKFFTTPEINSISSSITRTKNSSVFSTLKMKERYNMFVNGGYKKYAIKLIKQRLLD